MEFASIGSGSKGNCSVVRQGKHVILFDCGFSALETKSRLRHLGLALEDITAIFVSHEHGDHSKGVAAVAKKAKAPVYLTKGTFRRINNLSVEHCQWMIPDHTVTLAELKIVPVTVPHDAIEPCQFVVESPQGLRLGIVSDCGHITPHMIMQYGDCHALMLECNHDLAMLENGSYPRSLKKRVSGQYGHLNNIQSAQFLSAIQTQKLQKICITHLSEQNNHPDLALNEIANIKNADVELMMATQEHGFSWQKIHAEF